MESGSYRQQIVAEWIRDVLRPVCVWALSSDQRLDGKGLQTTKIRALSSPEMPICSAVELDDGEISKWCMAENQALNCCSDTLVMPDAKDTLLPQNLIYLQLLRSSHHKSGNTSVETYIDLCAHEMDTSKDSFPHQD